MPEQHSPDGQTVYDEIKAERERQDQRWGGPEHDDEHSASDWANLVYQYLYSAFGEAEGKRHDAEGYRGRMLQVAALAVAAIESHDRKAAPR